MSKTDLKKHLQQLTKEEVINIVLEYYSESKEARNYFDYMLAPNVGKKLEECKKVILNEYYPKRGWGRTRISVCKKAISDFSKLKPGDEMLAEAMVCLIETACQYTWDYGDMEESFYTAVENNFVRTMKFLAEHGLVEKFQPRITQILKYASVCGYGFCDSMPDIAREYGANAKVDRKQVEKEYRRR